MRPLSLASSAFLVFVAGTAAVASAGCLAFEHVNTRPVAVIDPEDPNMVPHQGGTVVVSGKRSYDDDGDALSYAWSAQRCTATMCEPWLTSANDTLTLLIDDPRRIFVTLTVTDSFGAVSHAAQR